MRTNILNGLKVIAVAAVLSLGISYVYGFGPTSAPPSGNAAAPLNVSATAQTKAGALTINGAVITNSTLTSNGALTAASVTSGWLGGGYTTPITGASYGGYGLSGSSATNIGVYGSSFQGLSPGPIGVEGVGNIGVAGYGSTAPGYGAPLGVGIFGSGSSGGPDFKGAGGEHGGAGVWTNSSDRNLKENFTPVDNQSILSKIMQLPMTEWNYKADKTAEHIGPIAQDFSAIFGLGDDNVSISTIDPSGIALVGVKALNEKIDAQQKEIDELKAEIDALKK